LAFGILKGYGCHRLFGEGGQFLRTFRDALPETDAQVIERLGVDDPADGLA